MIVAIYIRKSRKDKSEKAYRLEYQLEYLPRYAKSQGWSYEVFNEGITTATDIKKLPQLQRLISRLSQFDGILTIDYTRFSRDSTLQDYVFFLNQCVSAGIKLATPQTIRNPRINSEWFMLLIEGGFSAFEMKNLADRFTEARKMMKDQGRWLGGHAPTGYKHNPATKSLEIYPRETELISKICQLAVDHSVLEIEKKLRRGYRMRTGIPINIRFIRRILDDRRLLFYSGQAYNSKGEIIKADHPAIISDKLRREILLSKKSRLRRGPGRTTKSNQLLTGLGILRCGYCGRSVKSWKGHKERRTVRTYYRCSASYEKSKPCRKSKLIQTRFIDEPVINDLIETFINPRVIKQAYGEALKYLKTNPQAKRIQSLSKEIELRERKKDSLIYALGELKDDDRIIAEIKTVNQDINELYSKLKELEQGQAIPLKLSDLMSVAKRIKNFRSFDRDIQRQIISTLIKRIQVFRDRLRIEYYEPFGLSTMLIRSTD